MLTADNLERFITAQATGYQLALSELKAGRKEGHWIWYIFPQVAGLGASPTSKYYAISGLAEAEAYLSHPVLGERLAAACQGLLELRPGRDAVSVLGMPDAMKLKSSMTLFLGAQPRNQVFAAVLKKFFNGDRDSRTLQILRRQRSQR